MSEPKGISFVATSCGRFDLLEKTLGSFLRANEHPIDRYILIEDSGDRGVYDVAARFPEIPFEILFNEKRIGQIASIDRAYACVETPYIFHCEDDWEFIKPGFIAPSLRLLKAHPEACQVWLRNPLAAAADCWNMQRRETSGIRFYQIRGRPAWTLNFNPGLRRLADYRRAGSYQSLGDREENVGAFYSREGFRLFLLGGSPYCRHLGKQASMISSDPSIRSAPRGRRGKRAAFFQRLILLPRLLLWGERPRSKRACG